MRFLFRANTKLKREALHFLPCHAEQRASSPQGAFRNKPVNFACLLYSLRLLFRAKAMVLREAMVKICALRESNSPLPAPSSRVRRFSDLLHIFRRVLAKLRTLRGAVMSVSEAQFGRFLRFGFASGFASCSRSTNMLAFMAKAAHTLARNDRL